MVDGWLMALPHPGANSWAPSGFCPSLYFFLQQKRSKPWCEQCYDAKEMQPFYNHVSHLITACRAPGCSEREEPSNLWAIVREVFKGPDHEGFCHCWNKGWSQQKPDHIRSMSICHKAHIFSSLSRSWQFWVLPWKELSSLCGLTLSSKQSYGSDLASCLFYFTLKYLGRKSKPAVITH